jgi:hypothetical protein
MPTILRILERAGGYRPTLYLKIENPPYLALVIEATPEPGPLGLPGLSVAHYGKQNGDPMRDPEMCFELSKAVHLDPYYWRNDYYVALPDLHKQHERFAAEWDGNLRLQGFVEAFTDAAIRG